MQGRWTCVRLFSNSVALTRSYIAHRSPTHAIETNEENPFALKKEYGIHKIKFRF